MIFPCSVSASTAELGDNLSWKIDGSILKIEGNGDMSLTYEYLSQIPWYEQRNDIDTIIVGEGITSIAEGAFTAFANLKSVTLPSTMTYIASAAFLSCTALEHLVLPNRITQIDSGAFVGCESLHSITIPGSVNFISSDAFYNCYNLMIVGIPGSYAEQYAKENNITFNGTLSPLSEILVSVNNRFLFFEQPPVIVNDRTLVPLRAIFEALNAKVDWDAKTRTVTAQRGDVNLSLVIDTNIINKNGTNIEIDVPAKIINDKTMVPVRAISESLGASVNWYPKTRIITIVD